MSVSDNLRDPVLPQLRTLLSEQLMRDELQRLTTNRDESNVIVAPTSGRGSTGSEVVACKIVWTKYRPADHLRIAYEVHTADPDNGTRRVSYLHGRAYAATEAAQFYSSAQRHAHAVDGALPALSYLPALGLTLWAFPNDRKLPLRQVLNPRYLRDRLATSFGIPAAIDPNATFSQTTIGYIPEQSFTQRLTITHDEQCHVVYAKTVNEHYDGALPAELPRALHSNAQVSSTSCQDAPLIASYWPETRTIVQRAVTGEPLASLRRDRLTWISAMGAAGAALARFHSQTYAPRRAAPRPWQPALERNRHLLALVAPRFLNRFDSLARILLARTASMGNHEVLLHGDLHSHNILFDGQQIAFIDLEDVHRGSWSDDLGSFWAGLLVNPLLASRRIDDGPYDVASRRWALNAFWQSYQQAASWPVTTAVLRQATLRSLLTERIYRSITHVTPILHDDLEAILHLAETLPLHFQTTSSRPEVLNDSSQWQHPTASIQGSTS